MHACLLVSAFMAPWNAQNGAGAQDFAVVGSVPLAQTAHQRFPA